MTFPPREKILPDILFCLAFFTRLPVPAVDHRERSLADAVWAAPVAGVVVGLAGGVVYAVAVLAGLSPSVAAGLALAATMLATGCLHEDGLSDVADGFGGGATRERKLEIMRDSRIGAFGACALVLSILLRWSAIADLDVPVRVVFALIAAHAASRALLPALMAALPPARHDGLAAGAGAASVDVALLALCLGGACLFLLGVTGAVLAALCLGLVFLLVRRLCLNQIGGHTGDTLGALQQLGEIAILLAASAILH
ncbi:MAG: adenosylcobinamide-GDP ribazoletransferase [Rhizobiaceae bacterium]